MQKIRSAVEAYAADARAALRIAPVEVAIGLVTATTLSWAIEVDALEEWSRIGLAALIAFPLVFTASTLYVAGVMRTGKRWVYTSAVLVAVALYVALLFDHQRPAEVWRAGILGAAALVVPTLTPTMMRARSVPQREWFWLFNTRLLLRLVTVIGFAAALMVGLWAAVGAVSGLFDVRIGWKAYAHVASVLLLGFAPWAIAGGIPLIARESAPAVDQALVYARRVGLYLLLPLLAVYIAILYAYAVRILFVTELPRNLVSPLVLAAGAMWLLAAIVLEPFHWLPRMPGVARIVRVLPILILPLVVLGAWAIALRIQEYGWTEFRYIRLVALAQLGILATIGLLRLLRREAPPLFSIPLVIALLLVPSALGPWSAPAVSKGSQRAVLAQSLRDAGFTSLPVPIPSDSAESYRDIAPLTYERLTGSTRYLILHFGARGLEGLLSGDVSSLRHGADAGYRLGLMPGEDGGERRVIHAYLPAGTAIPLPDGGDLYHIEAGFGGAAPHEAKVGEVTLRVEAGGTDMVVLAPGAPPLTASLIRFAESVQARVLDHNPRSSGVGPNRIRMRYLQGELGPNEGVLQLMDPTGQPRGLLVIRNVGLATGPDPWRTELPSPGAAANTGGWTLERLDAFLIVFTKPRTSNQRSGLRSPPSR